MQRKNREHSLSLGQDRMSERKNYLVGEVHPVVSL